jgi:hypothetical protein
MTYLEESKMKRAEKYVIEMAAADLKDIDLENSSTEEIAKKYVDNYKKRTGKEFNAQAAAGIKKSLKDRDDVDAIIAAARKYAEIKAPKSHAERSKESNEKKKEANAERTDKMSQNVSTAAKRAWDAYNTESFVDAIRMNSGLLTEGKDSKTAKCPDCGNKYLVKSGYCLSCKKKVAASVDTDCKKKKKEIKEASDEQSYMKDGVKVYKTDGVVFYKGNEYKIPKEVVALKDLK